MRQMRKEKREQKVFKSMAERDTRPLIYRQIKLDSTFYKHFSIKPYENIVHASVKKKRKTFRNILFPIACLLFCIFVILN